MAKSEDQSTDHRPTLKTAAPPALLGLLAACFSVSDLLAATALPASRAWQPLGVLAMNLLMVGAIWGLSRLKPSILKAVMLSLLMGIIALAGFSVSAKILQILVAAKTLFGPWAWQTAVMFTSNLVIGVGAIWGVVWLKPWKGSREPVSPATRRSNRLYWLKEWLAALSLLALIFGAYSKDHPFAVVSNSPVPVWIAILAITSWLLARVLREWWRSSADEHERRASDFGRNAATGVFLAVTPAWWVAARAGLLPQPDAMVLWILTMMVSTIGWSWQRYR